MNRQLFEGGSSGGGQRVSDEEMKAVVALWAEEQRQREASHALPDVAEGLGIPQEEAERLLAAVRARRAQEAPGAGAAAALSRGTSGRRTERKGVPVALVMTFVFVLLAMLLALFFVRQVPGPPAHEPSPVVAVPELPTTDRPVPPPPPAPPSAPR
jgi:hypothetical protein